LSQNESLYELAQDKRVDQIKKDFEKRIGQQKKRFVENSLRPKGPTDIDDIYATSELSCVFFHK